jgi:hypothetical protein
VTDKPNTRPWDNIHIEEEEEDEYDHALAYLLARYPDVEYDMATYAKIMEWGAASAITFAGALQWLCTAVITTHIRTPRWVKRVVYYAGRFLIGFAVAATIMWLVASLTV